MTTTPRHHRADDDLELDLELEALVDDVLDEPTDAVLDEPETEEAALPPEEPPPATPPPPRFVVGPAVVTVLEVLAAGPVASAAATLAGLVDALVEADAAREPDADGAPTPATSVTVHGAVVSLVTPATVDEVPGVLVRHGRLAATALAEGLRVRLVLRGAAAWGDVAAGAGLLLGSALDEALAWRSVDHVGVQLAPSAALATSGAGEPEPMGWVRADDRTLLRWSDDPRAVERALAALGRFTDDDVARSSRTLAFLRSVQPT